MNVSSYRFQKPELLQEIRENETTHKLILKFKFCAINISNIIKKDIVRIIFDVFSKYLCEKLDKVPTIKYKEYQERCHKLHALYYTIYTSDNGILHVKEFFKINELLYELNFGDIKKLLVYLDKYFSWHCPNYVCSSA